MAGGQAGAVDFAYLEDFAGDKGVVREILQIFVDQAKVWRLHLRADDPTWRDVAHTIKGSALGIGARGLGEICARAEADGPDEIAAVIAALDEALAAIAAYGAA